MLQVAAEHTGSNQVRYVEGSAYSLPIAAKEYSSFVSVNLLSHLDDLNQFWHETARVLRPGSLALVTSPKVDSLFLPFGLIANIRGTAFGQDVHSVWHRRKTQLRAITAAGGTVRSIVGHYYTPRTLGGGSIGRLFHHFMRWADLLPPRLGDRLAPMDIYLVEF
jgi:SAM-dependent methyltransferase